MVVFGSFQYTGRFSSKNFEQLGMYEMTGINSLIQYTQG